jgi:multidrug resistance protein MdtO
MGTTAQSLPDASTVHSWLWQWLRDELTPYPGRARLVARMVVAATLVMIICMTFRIPYAFQGAIYVLLISRESLRGTLQSGAIILLVTAIGAGYLLVSASFVINFPMLHFLWIVGSLFLAFYAISALGNYIVGVTFAVMISVGVPLWDRYFPAETNVEDTLWLCLATLIGFGATAGMALAFARLRPGDEIVSKIALRLSAVETLLICYADRCAVDADTGQKIMHLAMLGTSLLRRILRRSDYSTQYCANMTGAAVLVGRLVDLAATLTQLRFELSATDQKRLRSLALNLASIRSDLMNRTIPAPIELDTDEPSSGIPLLGEMERTVALIPKTFLGSRSIQEYMPSSEDLPRRVFPAPDAVIDLKHFHFALKGCLAASASYVIYNAIDWPEISTAVTTCLLTALSTIGASHQKQILRIAGAIVGGFLIGMGSQIFILPHVDSIAGFTVLFALVTALSSWFLTSSPRLSYFGLQMALAFYFIHLQGFKIETSLAVARNRVVGILLGLIMMWIVFDRLWGEPAAVEMKKTFVSNLRLLAQLAREPVSEEMRIGIARTVNLRETINAGLDQVRDFADLVLFEFGPSRRGDLELRDHIRRWQPHLRTLFVMRIAALKYRLQLPGFELPESVRLQHRAYDDHSARMLEEMADQIEHNTSPPENTTERSHELLSTTVEGIRAEDSSQLYAGRIESFAALLREIDGLTTSLASEITAEFGRRSRTI